jgi:hypothetical protein
VQTKELLSVAATVAGERRTGDVLDAMVRGIAQQRGIALARIWLISAGDLCATCFLIFADQGAVPIMNAQASEDLVRAAAASREYSGQLRRVIDVAPRCGVRIDMKQTTFLMN